MKTSFQEYIYQVYWRVLDWVYPPDCAACGAPGYHLCKECQSKIRFISGPLKNTRHSTVLLSSRPGIFERIGSPGFSAAKVLAIYEGVVRECIHALKYNNNRGLGEIFSNWLADIVQTEGWTIDLVLPVALNPQRVHQRGYNQAAVIARPLAARLKKQYSPYVLNRIRNTPSQVGLSAAGRRQNVAGAFTADRDLVNGKNILLVDDVMTTGATLEACSLALSQAGASSVYCVTVAGFSTDIQDPYSLC